MSVYVADMNPQKQPHACPHCRRSFQRPRALRRHSCRKVTPLMSLQLRPPAPPPQQDQSWEHRPAPPALSPLAPSSRQPSMPALPPSVLSPPPPENNTTGAISATSDAKPTPPGCTKPTQLSPADSLRSSPGVRLSPACTPPRTQKSSPASPRSVLTPTRSHRPETCNAGVQVDGHYDPRQRARRRILDENRYFGDLRPFPPTDPANPDAPKDHSTRVDLRHQRRMCDCARCVRHANSLTSRILSAEIPYVRGLRFVRLPGVPVRSSTSADRSNQLVSHHAQKTLVVCGCPSCTSHRNFLAAWNQVRKYSVPGQGDVTPPEPRRQKPAQQGGSRTTPPPKRRRGQPSPPAAGHRKSTPPPPVVGGCRDSARDQKRDSTLN